jgi:CubicO group peptidase (beta-lactamase class C family)
MNLDSSRLAAEKPQAKNEEKPSPASKLDAWLTPQVAPLFDVAGAPGKGTCVVIGVAAPKLRHVFGYGVTQVGGAKPDGTTIFELGSVTKVYTGVLLGLALASGDLALDATIDAYFPKGAPKKDGKSITLLDLATHHSGLPDYDPGYSSGVPQAPGANYSEQDLFTCMAGGCPLEFAPGARAQYSNLGSGVLGYILCKKASAASFESLVSQKILTPLELSDTRVALSDALQPRCALGYANGRPAPSIRIGEPLAGSGALRATALDVLSFLESSFQASSPELKAAWQQVLEPRRPMGIANAQLGLQVAVEQLDGVTVYSKSGGTPGFSSYVVFSTSPPAAVVVLTNGKGLKLKPLATAALSKLESL